ncbi:hypothetical protein [Streptomyces sp. NPDC014006]|uniref:hypothetical protein n=1 Tax=Streptomyces sp. NPDC014006 TaxID=3364870 RepID=UPI0036F9989B
MKFLLDITLDEAASSEDKARELSRILRYWAGNVRHYPLQTGDGSAVYDSGYKEVGAWRVVAS